jgi:DNA modification methylase
MSGTILPPGTPVLDTKALLARLGHNSDVAFVADIEALLKISDDHTAQGTLGYIDIGRMLLARKEQGKRDGSIRHGQWVPWLKRHFPARPHTSLQEYMRVAKFMDAADAETKNRISRFFDRGFYAVLEQVEIEEKTAKRKPPPPALTVPGPLASRMKIVHADCRDVLPTITEPHFLVSDPPYNQGYHYDSYDDAMPKDEYQDMLVKAFGGKPSVVILYPEEIINLLGGGALGECLEVVTWVYNSNTVKQHRLVTWWNCKPDLTRLGQDYKNPDDKRVKRLIEAGNEARLYDWWEIDQVKNVSKDYPHPCPIPVELARRIILVTTNEGDLVVDPYSGSGTIPCVAAALGRRAIGIDVSARYCEIARSRLGTIAAELEESDERADEILEAAE